SNTHPLFQQQATEHAPFIFQFCL
ncbi:AMP nucleosidase, partial [Escherichia coli]